MQIKLQKTDANYKNKLLNQFIELLLQCYLPEKKVIPVYSDINYALLSFLSEDLFQIADWQKEIFENKDEKENS